MTIIITRKAVLFLSTLEMRSTRNARKKETGSRIKII